MIKQYRKLNGFVDIVYGDTLLEGFTEYSDDDKPSDVINKLSELENKDKINKKIESLKKFLAKTDNREYPSYICKEGEVLEDTIAKRVEARKLIRSLKQEN